MRRTNFGIVYPAAESFVACVKGSDASAFDFSGSSYYFSGSTSFLSNLIISKTLVVLAARIYAAITSVLMFFTCYTVILLVSLYNS